MRVLDLFSGLGGWAAPFRERGHEVVTVDIEPRFSPTICADILDVDAVSLMAAGSGGNYDVVLASPPCECFSVASIGKHWTPYKTPKTDKAKRACAVLSHTKTLIDILNPRFFVIENPRGMMRNADILLRLDRRTVTYCQYGETRMKPTDLWGEFPPSLELRQPCRNGDACHEKAPRGAKTGTQGIKGADKRAVIPYRLALDVCLACERDLTMPIEPKQDYGLFYEETRA